MNNLLPLLILLPTVAGFLLCCLGNHWNKLGAAVSLTTAGIVMALAILLMVDVPIASSNATDLANVAETGLIVPTAVYTPEWLSISLPISIHGNPIHWQLGLGVDGFSIGLVFLNALVTLAVLFTAQSQITNRSNLYAGLILITQGILMGVFIAMDLLLFYIFFEAVLIPIIILINLWGDAKESLRAARKFLIFTLAGSFPMVVGLVGLILQDASADKPSTVLLTSLSKSAYNSQVAAIAVPSAPSENAEVKTAEAVDSGRSLALGQTVIIFTLILGMAIKMALVPLHSWLPTTYSAAHPNTTALIAAVVGKMGFYGLLRIVLPLTPLALTYYAQLLIGALGAIAIVYGAMVALAQTDLRRLLAYSSISHMGFVTLGLMAMNQEGLAGASLQMVNHGLITAAMFLIVGMIEQRRGRFVLDDQERGLMAAFPRLGVCMVFFTLASVGLPGLNSFVGEILTMIGMTRVSVLLVAIAVLGVVLGAWYGLRVLQYVMFSSNGEMHSKGLKTKDYITQDIGTVELAGLLPLAAMCLLIGVLPSLATRIAQADVNRMSAALQPVSKGFHPDVDTLVASNRP